MGQGTSPTVEQAADAASVSRATAYRYFPSQQALLVELETGAVYAELEAGLDAMESRDVEARLPELIEAFSRAAAKHEAHMRRALGVYQDTWLRARKAAGERATPVRRGRRMGWLDRVLEPLPPLPPERLARLRAALALTIGADSIVILKDVVGLNQAEADEVLKWAATALLKAGLAEDE